jgi:branched-chain amino acid aminotransferase
MLLKLYKKYLYAKAIYNTTISEGCLNGVMRRQIIGLAKKIENIEVVEGALFPLIFKSR